MKKIRIYLAALLLLPGLSSCGDFLDKESYTDQDREILKTPEGIEALLNGVYDIFQHANYYGRNLMAYEAAKGNDFFVRVSSGNSFERENRYAESTASSGAASVAQDLRRHPDRHRRHRGYRRSAGHGRRRPAPGRG